MKLYGELAEWWPIFQSPGEYKVEAAYFARTLKESSKPPPRSLLELGSGGGNVAYHLKRHFDMTLVDLSPGMLAVSKALNPELEHIKGDIRKIRLGRTFDAVFVHDAICHMTTQADLRAAMKTAYEHLRPGGVALIVPDEVRETFAEETDHGGNDADRGGVRYLQWITDPNPRDNNYVVDFAIMIRDRKGQTRVVHDRHKMGLFPRTKWRSLLREVGFRLTTINEEFEDFGRDVFLGRRRRSK